MSKKSTTNIPDDTPIRAKDIASGKLAMRKRGAASTGRGLSLVNHAIMACGFEYGQMR